MSKPAKKRAKTRAPKSSLARIKTKRPSQPARSDAGARHASAATKQAQVIAMLRSSTGTTIAAMMRATGWQQHSIRGFLAGVVRKKLKLKLESNKGEGNRIYRIAGDGSAKAGVSEPKRSAA